jgi:SM-20-related protein
MAILNQNEQKFEQLIDGIVNQGFGVCDSFLSDDFAQALRKQLLSEFELNKFSAASIGQGIQHRQHIEIRNDCILWIESDSSNKHEREFLDLINDFMLYLNRSCFTGLQSAEFHYACYPKGSFYRKHVDSFVNDKSRQFSLIIYLNPDWIEEDGGQLKLYLKDKTAEILPQLGRAVFFQSDLIPHEVLIAQKNRLSITGWLKK